MAFYYNPAGSGSMLQVLFVGGMSNRAVSHGLVHTFRQSMSQRTMPCSVLTLPNPECGNASAVVARCRASPVRIPMRRCMSPSACRKMASSDNRGTITRAEIYSHSAKIPQDASRPVPNTPKTCPLSSTTPTRVRVSP